MAASAASASSIAGCNKLNQRSTQHEAIITGVMQLKIRHNLKPNLRMRIAKQKPKLNQSLSGNPSFEFVSRNPWIVFGAKFVTLQIGCEMN